MLRTFSNIGRLLRIAHTLAAYDALVPREYAEQVPPSVRMMARLVGRRRTRLGKDGDVTLPPGVRLAKALESLGPSAIKVGQLLATRPDIIGDEIARGLETLQDRLPPFSESEARAIVEYEMAQPIAAVFSAFGPPVAAASIAQVHEAQTTADPPRRVAVKVLRPGIEARFARDFDAFRFAARMAERFSREARRLRLITLVETLAASVALELDLRMEGAAASELAINMADEPDFRVPAMDWTRTRQRMLTTEWVEGTPLRDPAALRAAGHSPTRVAALVVQTFLTQALRDGFFHADMHPGNLFVDAEGRLCAVDFGIMGRLDARMRRFLAETLGGFLARDYERVAEIHFHVGFVSRAYSVQTFAQALRAIGEPILGLTARDVSMARLLEQLFETTRRFDMPLQPQLIMMQKTMMTVEGVCRQIDPDFDIWEHSRPVLEQWMVRNMGPEARLRDAAEGIGHLVKLAQNLPELLRDTEAIAAQLAQGGMRLHPDSVAAIAAMQLKRTRHVRVALWLTAGALGLIAAGML